MLLHEDVVAFAHSSTRLGSWPHDCVCLLSVRSFAQTKKFSLTALSESIEDG